MQPSDLISNDKLLKQLINDLTDATINAERALEIEGEVRNAKAEKDRHIRRERQVISDINAVMMNYLAEEKFEEFKPFSAHINQFVKSALEDYEGILGDILDSTYENKVKEYDAYRLKATRALESFFSRDPITVLESDISVKYVDGGYESRLNCKCPKDVEYEYLLNSSEFGLLKDRLTGSKLARGLRIPVRLGKTWVSRDVSVDKEKFDSYFLSSASLTGNNLIAIFNNEETGSEFRFHCSFSGDSTFLEVDYRDNIKSISLTSQPALNNSLDRDTILVMITKIKDQLEGLKDHRLRLVKIEYMGEDVLKSMNIFQLSSTILELLSPQVLKEAQRILNTDEEFRATFLNRISLIGAKSKSFLHALRIDQEGDQEIESRPA